MNLSQKWIGGTKWCKSLTIFLVLVNRTPVGFFQSSKGLRQVDHLSLFICPSSRGS